MNADRPRSQKLWRDAAFIVTVLFDAFLIGILLPHATPMTDGVSWWIVDLADPYGMATVSMVGSGAFRFAPAIAQLMAPLGLLPWTLYVAAFIALQLVAIVAMGGKRWPLVALFPAVLLNLSTGNVDTLLGAAIVLGFRWPGAWALLLLTKVTPGVGVLWYAFRGEWRGFAIALGATASVIVASFLLDGRLWFEWVDALRSMAALPQPSEHPPLWLRLPIAVAVVWFAARSGRAWLLPVACLIAMPNPWLVTYAILGASVALWARPRDEPQPLFGPIPAVAHRLRT